MPSCFCVYVSLLVGTLLVGTDSHRVLLVHYCPDSPPVLFLLVGGGVHQGCCFERSSVLLAPLVFFFFVSRRVDWTC